MAARHCRSRRWCSGPQILKAIAAAVDAWCVEHLGSNIAAYRFFDSSSGSVHGVALADGRDVVVKVHRPGLTRRFLDAVHDAQAALAARGVPAPRPLVAPVACGPAHITAETMIDARTPVDAHDPRVRRALAHGLAEFAAHGRRLGLERDERLLHPSAMPVDRLFPEPHSARFDFDATAAGAAWIDDLARRARAVLEAVGTGRPDSFGHGDWRIENLAVRDERVVAIYDWDSVCVEPEIVPVATAAITFCVDWDRPAGERFPSDGEIRAFVDEYEDARGDRFHPRERDALAARMTYGLAYGARCEHAIRYVEIPDSQQGLLRRLGPVLLERGLDALDP